MALRIFLSWVYESLGHALEKSTVPSKPCAIITRTGEIYGLVAKEIVMSMVLEKKSCMINGRRIAYLEAGVGSPIVLLHGNPTSSYLWRHVIPQLKSHGRVLAPDLIGHGDSDKLPPEDGPDRYNFQSTYDYLDGFLQAIGAMENVTLVVHDWGSALGFHASRCCARHCLHGSNRYAGIILGRLA